MDRNIVHIRTEAEMASLLAKILHIAINMRRAQNYWHEHFGYRPLHEKKRWESKMDGLLTELGITDHIDVKTIQALINADTYVTPKNKDQR